MTPPRNAARFDPPSRGGWRSALVAGVIALLIATIPATAAPSACTTLQSQISAAPTGPVFLASYPGTTIRELKDAAFLYDNALAVIALVACNDAPHARRIGDAILIALDHDRYWHDGRLRNGYASGALSAPVKLAGWWDDRQKQWVEDRYQVGSDTGNMAWAMLALLTLDCVTNDPRYRAGAIRLGTWLERWRDNRGAGGFTGGAFGHEPSPDALSWKSTEHNTDLAAAYGALAQSTGDKHWVVDADLAEQFVHAMWMPSRDSFSTGTGDDGVSPTLLQVLDVQVLPLLALRDTAPYAAHFAALARKFEHFGEMGYSRNLMGFWTEGAAQGALLMSLRGDAVHAAALNRMVALMRAPNGGYYASDSAALATGFMLDTDPTRPRKYFHIPALAPTAWAALAEQGFNPFTGTRALPR